MPAKTSAFFAASGFLASCGAEAFSFVDAVTNASVGDGDAGIANSTGVLKNLPHLLPNGVTCARADQCDTGFCVDGFCCQGACGGLCQSCAVAGQEGTCAPQAAGSDPNSECADQGVATCGQDGFCDGAGHCSRYHAGAACAMAVCSQDMLSDTGTCDDHGVCQKPATVSCGKFPCASPIACRTTCASTADCLPPNVCFAGACGGVTGQYFNAVDFTMPVLTRVDPGVNFDWTAGSPAAGVNADLFSVRWTGTLTPKFSETYTFYLASNDGERFFLDDTAVIANFVDHVATPEDTGTIALTAGKAYKLRIDYYERYSNASINLSWSSPSQPREIIPTGALSPM